MFNSPVGNRRLDPVISNFGKGWNVFHRKFPVVKKAFALFQVSTLRIKSLRKILSAFFRHLVNFKFYFVSVFLIILGLAGCGSHVYHFVEPGETLYSISWAYGHDYREVAQWNNIPPPYVVKRGQRLRVAAINRVDRTGDSPKKPIKNKVQIDSGSGSKGGIVSADTKVSKNLQPVVSQTSRSEELAWQWPVKGGKIIETFDAGNPARQGVDVKGNFGEPVYSAEAGRVVYSGGGLKHYGKLIIVKHNETFLSAYAHNKRLLVKEGDVLKSGQRIAEMGSTGTNTTKLHFEIRRDGKPVNPLSYLPRR